MRLTVSTILFALEGEWSCLWYQLIERRAKVDDFRMAQLRAIFRDRYHALAIAETLRIVAAFLRLDNGAFPASCVKGRVMTRARRFWFVTASSGTMRSHAVQC